MDGGITERKKMSRNQRLQLKARYLNQENATMSALVGKLLDTLDRAIQPGITDAERIRYRCMIQDIREELHNNQQAAA